MLLERAYSSYRFLSSRWDRYRIIITDHELEREGGRGRKQRDWLKCRHLGRRLSHQQQDDPSVSEHLIHPVSREKTSFNFFFSCFDVHTFVLSLRIKALFSKLITRVFVSIQKRRELSFCLGSHCVSNLQPCSTLCRSLKMVLQSHNAQWWRLNHGLRIGSTSSDDTKINLEATVKIEKDVSLFIQGENSRCFSAVCQLAKKNHKIAVMQFRENIPTVYFNAHKCSLWLGSISI